MSEKRKCFYCESYVAPGTKHFILNDEIYCEECVEVIPYTSYQYLVGGEYEGDSNDNESQMVEDYEDFYTED